MKKVILVFYLLFLTGCSNKMVCTMTVEEENYETNQELVFEFNKEDNVEKSTVNYIMVFKTEEEAKSYLNVFQTINEDYDITLEKNTIEIKSEKNYEQYESKKSELKEKLEKDGYSCK